jgi:hypothetical protein
MMLFLQILQVIVTRLVLIKHLRHISTKMVQLLLKLVVYRKFTRRVHLEVLHHSLV